MQSPVQGPPVRAVPHPAPTEFSGTHSTRAGFRLAPPSLRERFHSIADSPFAGWVGWKDSTIGAEAMATNRCCLRGASKPPAVPPYPFNLFCDWYAFGLAPGAALSPVAEHPEHQPDRSEERRV